MSKKKESKILKEIRERARRKFEKSKKEEKESLEFQYDFDLQPIFLKKKNDSVVFLPFEIMEIIFSFLSPSEILRIIALVCKGWNLNSSSNRVWKEKYLKRFKKNIFYTKSEKEDNSSPIDISWKRSYLSHLQTLRRWKRNLPTNVSYFGISKDELLRPEKYLAVEHMKRYRKRVRYHPSEFRDPYDEDDDDKFRRRIPVFKMAMSDKYLVMIDSSMYIMLFDKKTLNPIREYKSLVKLSRKKNLGMTNLNVLDVMQEEKKIVVGALFENKYSIYLIEMVEGKIEFAYYTNNQVRGLTLNEEKTEGVVNEMNQICILDLKNKENKGLFPMKGGNQMIMFTDFNEEMIVVFCQKVDGGGLSGMFIDCYSRKYKAMIQSIKVEDITFPVDMKILHSGKIVKLISKCVVRYYGVVDGKMRKERSNNFVNPRSQVSCCGKLLIANDYAGQVVVYNHNNGTKYGTIIHNRAGGALTNVIADELNLIYGTQLGAVIKKFFGPKDLYWKDLEGKRLMEDEEKGEEENINENEKKE